MIRERIIYSKTPTYQRKNPHHIEMIQNEEGIWETKKETNQSVQSQEQRQNTPTMDLREISQWLDIPWGTDEEIASREMGQSGTDVRLRPRVRKLFPFSVETKNQERWSMDSFIKQAKDNCYENTNWLLILKKNRVNPIVVIDATRYTGYASIIYPDHQHPVYFCDGNTPTEDFCDMFLSLLSGNIANNEAGRALRKWIIEYLRGRLG